jgi:hemolysin D
MDLIERFGELLRRVTRTPEPDYRRAFLPAALEVVETPPSPTGRALGLIIILFFLTALVWALVGRVDIMATARGRLTPVGDTKTIQPLESGLVRAILVQNGQRVHRGDLLVQLDPTQPNADTSRVSGDEVRAELDLVRLGALRRSIETGAAPVIVSRAGLPEPLVREARVAAAAAWQEHVAKLSQLDGQISRSEAEAAEIKAQIDKLNAAIPMLAAKEKIHHDLTEQGYGTTLSYLDSQQQTSDARHEVNVQQQKLVQVQAARLVLLRQRDEVRSEFSDRVLGDLRKAQAAQGELQQDVVKARSRSSATELRAPIDGVVDQLIIHTLGGVVTPAQTLMIVVPESKGLIVQAQLSDRDAGFVHSGQAAKVKVETFNFTRYGLLDGKVINVSRDVISPPYPPSPEAARSPDRGLAPAYVARILPARSSMLIDGREEPLQPGMAVTVEIRTGTRTVLDYLLSPIARRTQDSLHER